MRISLGLATYQRPRQLQLLLGDLLRQTRPPDEVVVVDNDPAGSGRSVVEAMAACKPPFTLHYEIQPAKNISLTRNRSVALASGDWFASLDDDERVNSDWLQALVSGQRQSGADGLLGPVEYSFPPGVPAFLKYNDVFQRRRFESGATVPRDAYRFGNVLLRMELLRQLPGPFDPAYGLTGGEDGDLLCRLNDAGARICWCNEAEVFEPVEPARTRTRWVLLRALRGGQDYARHFRRGYYGHPGALAVCRFIARAAAQMLVALALSLLAVPIGRARVLHWLVKAASNLGKLSIWGGWHYREYQQPA